MKYLNTHFTVVSLADIGRMRAGQLEFPSRVAVVTFDDGYEDNYTQAVPILHQYELTATFFLVTGFVEGNVDIAQSEETYRGLRPLSWSQIREMRADGFSFGSHTHTHPILSDLVPSEVEHEIGLSKRLLEERLGEHVELFAYPLGQRRALNRGVIRAVANAGFRLACSTLWGTDNRKGDPLLLRRVRVDPHDTFADFQAKVHGRWDFVAWVQAIR